MTEKTASLKRRILVVSSLPVRQLTYSLAESIESMEIAISRLEVTGVVLMAQGGNADKLDIDYTKAAHRPVEREISPLLEYISGRRDFQLNKKLDNAIEAIEHFLSDYHNWVSRYYRFFNSFNSTSSSKEFRTLSFVEQNDFMFIESLEQPGGIETESGGSLRSDLRHLKRIANRVLKYLKSIREEGSLAGEVDSLIEFCSCVSVGGRRYSYYNCGGKCRQKIEKLKKYMEQRYTDHIRAIGRRDTEEKE